jgi:hypothetical protein
MNGCYRTEQDGFVSEYEYQELHDKMTAIFYPVTGHFVRLKDDPKALFLYNDDARIYHLIDKVSFLHRVSNPIEGEKLYPRPFITEQTDDEKKIEGYKFGSKIISTGDKVTIIYVNGSIFNPLVIGSVEPFGSFYQNNFLLTKPDEWEQEKKRLENEDYILEYKDDSHGRFTFDITAKVKDSAKGNQGGTGNITIHLTGTETNGKITVVANGDAKLNVKSLNINDGSNGAARKEDEIKSTSSEDNTYWTWLSSLITSLAQWINEANSGATPSPTLAAEITTWLASNPTPSSLTGKITKSSDTVKIGN